MTADQVLDGSTAEDEEWKRRLAEGWCPVCGGKDGEHKPGCEDGSEVL